LDQLACDHPTTPQVYRIAICGNFDVVVCNKRWSYIPAPLNAKSESLIWGTAWIDPGTGRYAKENAPGALHVWTFRDRPIYIFSGDEPGETNGDGWGEGFGLRNGFRAFWIRDEYLGLQMN
jgi:hypothetical protein